METYYCEDLRVSPQLLKLKVQAWVRANSLGQVRLELLLRRGLWGLRGSCCHLKGPVVSKDLGWVYVYVVSCVYVSI